jgi:hypothetical protein
VTGRRGRRRRKLLDDLKERRRYSHLKEEALDRTMWRARFGRGFGPVVRQTTKLNELQLYSQTIALGSVFVIILISTSQFHKRHDTYKKCTADKKAKCGKGLWNDISYRA